MNISRERIDRRARAGGADARGSIETADGTPDEGYLAARPLGLDLLDPATWRGLIGDEHAIGGGPVPGATRDAPGRLGPIAA